MFKIEMLPADHGDCLLLEYGEAARPHRVLIDGGTPGTAARLAARLEKLPPEQHRFELLIVTHIDVDHIGGVLNLMRDAALTFDDVWFNGWHHLEPGRERRKAAAASGLESDWTADFLGPKQGEALGKLLTSESIPWNLAFGGGAVVVPDDGELPVRTLPGGLKLTLLSPLQPHLLRLDREWRKVIREYTAPAPSPVLDGFLGAKPRAGDLSVLAQTPFTADTAPANGSSIAVLAEYEGKRCLLAADAFASTLVATLARLPGATGPVALDAFKLPHHGSRANVSRELVQRVACHRYLISTSGKMFQHPDVEALARVVMHGPGKVLHFNYLSDTTRMWRDPALQAKHDFTATFPPEGEPAVIEL